MLHEVRTQVCLLFTFRRRWICCTPRSKITLPIAPVDSVSASRVFSSQLRYRINFIGLIYALCVFPSALIYACRSPLFLSFFLFFLGVLKISATPKIDSHSRACACVQAHDLGFLKAGPREDRATDARKKGAVFAKCLYHTMSGNCAREKEKKTEKKRH